MSNLQIYRVKEHKTAYAFKNNQLVHISVVARGLACDCVCVACGRRLIARKGPERIDHFAHAVDTECSGAAETALHLLAKELFKELTSVVLPQYKFEKEKVLKRSYAPVRHEQIVANGGEVPISMAFIEQAEDRFTPDITLESNSKRLFIEIAVTHKVDRNKLRHIRKQGLPAIEIYLDLADAILSREELYTKLKNDINSKRWLFHPKQREAERIFIDKVRAAMRNARKPAIKTQRNTLTRPQTHIPTPNGARNEGFSNAQMDRMRYEFFLKFRRQPTDEEAPKLQAILYGNRMATWSNEPSYASIKGKRED